MQCHPLHPLEIVQNADGSIYAPQYDDRLFSCGKELDEATHVFLRGNDLADRMAGEVDFVIGELGFGTGLNFLLTWNLFQQVAKEPQQLDYISIEKHPCDQPTLVAIHARWPSLATLAQTLRASLPPIVPGFHRVALDGGRVRLTLCFGDASDVLPELTARADAWFLDGFSPAKNPAMWQTDVLRHVSRCTKPGGTFSTFTSAGYVRRALETTGFLVTRCAGFGSKRHSLRGTCPAPAIVTDSSPWYATPQPSVSFRGAPANVAIVIGAGLAGCAAARALAERCVRVHVLEQKQTCAEASGVPMALCQPRISSSIDIGHQYATMAYCFAVRRLSQLGLIDSDRQLGCLHLARVLQPAQHPYRTLFRASSDEEMFSLSGVTGLNRPGMLIDGVCIRPSELCNRLLDHTAITLHAGQHVNAMNRDADSNCWTVSTASGDTFQGSTVILASGHVTSRFHQCSYLPLRSVRGQVTQIAATPASQALRLPVLIGDVWITPTDCHGMHTIGATFDRDTTSSEVVEADHMRNLQALQKSLPEFASALGLDSVRIADCKDITGWAGVRATFPDRLPAIGPIPDFAAFARQYETLHHGRQNEHFSAPKWQQGLYCTVGHGARGVAGSLYAAELLASCICGTPAHMPRSLLETVHPARFIIRELRKPPECRTPIVQ